MFKMTKTDLAQKTDAQLFALFQEVSQGLNLSQPSAALVQSQLAMISAEMAKRGPSP